MLQIDKVNDLLRKVGENHHFINSGGCAAMSVIILDTVGKQLDNYRIVSTERWSDCDECIDEVRHELWDNHTDEWMEHNIHFNHVWIEFEQDGVTYAMDSTGIRPAEDMHEMWNTPYEGSFTLDEMRVLSGDTQGWNTMFDRGQLPSIRAQMTRGAAKLSE